jgi:glycosyltransferase involved in cell wall biosynthesis
MGLPELEIAYLAIIDIAAEGAENRHVFEMCENWNRLGYKVTVFVPNTKGVPSERVGVQIVKMQTFRLKASFLLSFLFSFMSIFYLMRRFSRKGIDIVYTRQSMFEFIPVFFMKQLGVRYVAEVNGIDSEQKRLYGMAKWKIYLSEWLHTLCYCLADSIVTVTDEIRDYLAERYPKTKGKTFVLSNGANVDISIPIPKEDACRRLGLSSSCTYLVFVGSLKKWHGVENAILLLERLVRNGDKVRLLVIGDGPEKEYLENVTKTKGLEECVNFVGKVQYRRVPLYIATASACLALFDNERNDRTGLSPLKIFEYMSCAKPVVTTDVGNLRRIIERHECGIIVKPGDIDGMAEAVMRLIRDPELAKELGDNGRAAATSYYNWGMISEKVLEIICGVAKRENGTKRRRNFRR